MVCGQEFWYTLFGLETQLEQPDSLKMTILHEKIQVKDEKYDQSSTVFLG